MAIASVQPAAPNVLNLLGGLLLVALGTWVLTVRPRRAPHLALAVFTIALGVRFTAGNLAGPVSGIFVLTPDDPWLLVVGAARLVGMATAAAAAVAIGALVPSRLSWRTLRSPLAVAALQLLACVLAYASLAADVRLAVDGGPLLNWLWLLEYFVRYALLPVAFTVVLLSLVGRVASASAGERRGIALASAAFMVLAGVEIASIVSPRAYLLALPSLLAFGLAVALWLRAGEQVPEARRAAVALAILFPAAILLGRVGGAIALDRTGGIPGVSRILGAGILTYAILRAQLLGMDARVRWGIQRSTVAAIFVAVFFVATEAAQQVFSARGAYFGILVAGALLFALAPLQRVAERVANAAVPQGAPKPMAAGDRAWAYTEAARAAWADGTLTRDERAMLDRLRLALGIAEDEAHRIEREAAHEPPART